MSEFWESVADAATTYVDAVGTIFWGVDDVESSYDEAYSAEEQAAQSAAAQDVAIAVASMFGYGELAEEGFEVAEDIGNVIEGEWDDDGTRAGADLELATLALRLDVARAVETTRGPWAALATSKRIGTAVVSDAEERRLIALGRAVSVLLREV